MARDRRRVLTLLLWALPCALAAQAVHSGSPISGGSPVVPIAGTLGQFQPAYPLLPVSPNVPTLPPSFELLQSLPGGEKEGKGVPSAPLEPISQAQQPILQRLTEDFPSEQPKPSDWQGAREYAQKAFEFKAGAAPADMRGKANAPTPQGEAADDGGGPNYPSRAVTFHNQTFRSVLLRPNAPVEAEIIRVIDTAKQSVHIALSGFKQKAVLQALRSALNRGVEVHVILDFASAFPLADPNAHSELVRSPEIWSLLRNNFDVKVVRGLGRDGMMNANIAVADYNEKGDKPQIAIFGSYEWTFTAETNYYNSANLSTSKDTVEAVMKTWKWLESLGQPVRYSSNVSDYAWPNQVDASPFEVKPTIALGKTLLLPAVVSPNRVQGQSFEDWIAAAIGASKRKIDISATFIRSRRIVDALAQARAKGVEVRVIVDRKKSSWLAFGPFAQWLAAQGIEVRTLAGPDPKSPYPAAQTMDHKFAIFDDEVVETGSPDFTKRSAIANFELAHFLKRDAKNPGDVEAYLFAFEHMWRIAVPIDAPSQAPVLPTDAELIAEVDLPPPQPATLEPHPRPAPGVQAREVLFNGHAHKSFMFRPDDPIEPELIAAIKGTRKSIRISLYEFTLGSALDALRWLKQNKPEVKIEIVVDRSHVYTSGKDRDENPNMPSDQIVALIEEGFDVLVLKGEHSGIQHNKYLLIDAEDGGMVVSGSYNLTEHAEHAHYENVFFSTDRERVLDYMAYFDYQRSLAEPVDRDKLDEVRNRTASKAHAEEMQLLAASLETQAARGGGAAARAKYPDPPLSRSTPVTLNGQSFFKTYFSPHGQIEGAVLRAINAAAKSVEVAMFSFYSRTIADALAAAVKRGVEVYVVLDADQAKLTRRFGNFDGMTVDEWLAAHGVHVRLLSGPDKDGDPHVQKMHDKFIVIDRKMAKTGSFNFSDNAQNNNFENENVIVDPTDVAGYADMFARMFSRGWPPKSQEAASHSGAKP